MNDPHIEALHYSVQHTENVDYANASPRSYDKPGFTLRIENGRAEITMKSHHATVDAARDEVEPFLRAWELTAALDLAPGAFRLVYDQAKIIDRNPTPGMVTVPIPGAAAFSAAGTIGVHIGHSKYPDPPTEKLVRDENVELMFTLYCRYRAGRTQLGVAANYCLGVLKMASADLGGPARHYAVSHKVLGKLSTLASRRGGIEEGRKPDVAKLPYSATERHWLEETLKRLILRAAEVAANPSATLCEITLADLPTLSET